LKKISDENYERFNRNVDYEEIKKQYIELQPPFFKITKLMEHSTFMGLPTEKHFRCFLSPPDISYPILQDISIEQ